MKIILPTLLISLLLTTNLIGQNWIQKGMDIDGESANDQSSIVGFSDDGNIVAVGAPLSATAGVNTGQTRIFEYDGTNWQQLGLSLFGDAVGNHFGTALDLSPDGKRVAVGSNGDDTGGVNAGKVEVYEWDGTSWNLMGLPILGENSGDSFGYKVSLSADGSTLVAGASMNNNGGTKAGNVRVFDWNGANWLQRGLSIDGDLINGRFGIATRISHDGNTIVVGAFDESEAGPGYVRVFNWTGSIWSQVGSTIQGDSPGDYFGWSVDISAGGDTIIAGATLNDDNGSNSGHVKIYALSGGAWNQIGLTLVGDMDGDLFGYSVRCNNSGNTVVIGAEENDLGGSNAGNTKVYRWNGSSWLQIGNNILGEAAGDLSGHTVGISGDGSTIAIGAWENNDGGTNSGHVRVFSSPCTISSGTDVQTACDSYTWIDGNTYTASNNTATFTLTNAAGCDSTVTLDLTINTSTTGTDVQTACDSYTWIDGNTYTASNNTATFTLTNAAGCDSTVTLDLTINTSTTGTDVQTACDSYTWIDGNTYTASNNTATFTLTNAAGCDSLVMLDLTINTSTTGTDVQTACDSYTWIDGNTYTASNNTATFTLTNAAGCDSLVMLNLTINTSTTGTDVQTACDSYTWIDGNTYTASNNTATFTLTNAAGCDSTVTLDLTINTSTTGTDVQTACDSYTWIDGNTYTASNNTATFTLTNAAGCDSTVTLDLTINTSTTGTDVQTACDSYTWIDGNTYTASNNTATFTLTNAAGCDSLVMLNLTINTSTTGTDVQTACDSYTWIDGNTYTASNNTATFTLTNAAGCDSTVTLDLTINTSTTGTDVQTACDSYTWIDGNTYTASNNTATFTLTNAAGCDSLVTLDLTINTVDVSITDNSPTLTANAVGATYQWLDCDNNFAAIFGEVNQSFTSTSNGNYAVKVLQIGCVDTSTCVLVTNVGHLELFESNLVIYPNPSSSGLFIVKGLSTEDKEYTIYNSIGQVVNSGSIQTKEFVIDLSNEESGMYFVSLVTANNVSKKIKLIIE